MKRIVTPLSLAIAALGITAVGGAAMTLRANRGSPARRESDEGVVRRRSGHRHHRSDRRRDDGPDRNGDAEGSRVADGAGTSRDGATRKVVRHLVGMVPRGLNGSNGGSDG